MVYAQSILVLSSLGPPCLFLPLTIIFSESQTFPLSLPFPLRTVTTYYLVSQIL
jgi:hypothetical protein